MNWAVLIPIIATYGLPLAERLWQLSTGGGPPTQAEWDELKQLAKLRAVDQMRVALRVAGVSEDSQEGKALLAAATTEV